MHGKPASAHNASTTSGDQHAVPPPAHETPPASTEGNVVQLPRDEYNAMMHEMRLLKSTFSTTSLALSGTSPPRPIMYPMLLSLLGDRLRGY